MRGKMDQPAGESNADPLAVSCRRNAPATHSPVKNPASIDRKQSRTEAWNSRVTEPTRRRRRVPITGKVRSAASVYFLIRIFRITGGVTGLLLPPSLPRVVGSSAIASTTSRPETTRPKIV